MRTSGLHANGAWRCRLSAVAVVAALAALLAVPASADEFPANFGERYLETPCCGGAQLGGTSASLNVNTISPDSPHCLLFRSDAEIVGHLIQAGLVKCGVNTSLDGACSLSNNLVKFVEIQNSSGYHCYAHGDASTGFEYDPGVHITDGTWYSFISGTSYETTTFGSATLIIEGGEHTNTTSCSGWTGSAVFAGDSSHVWQRYDLNAHGTDVQSASTNNGCWLVSGGPPGSFSIN